MSIDISCRPVYRYIHDIVVTIFINYYAIFLNYHLNSVECVCCFP